MHHVHVLPVILLCVWAGVGYANEEITVDLPGGAKMEMVWIEPGTFLMGSPEEEIPQHQETIRQGFWLGKYELTQEQWTAVMGTRLWRGEGNVQEGPHFPATYISWDDVQAFVHRVNQATGDSLYRLPTSAEWEYACRAGTTTRWSFGDDESLLTDYAWYAGNTLSGRNYYYHTVGTKLPNPWGLYDMHGNVWEWCQDEFVWKPSINHTYRIFRGGGFYDAARYTRSAVRNRLNESYTKSNKVGARLLRMGSKIAVVTPQSWGAVKAQSH